MPRPRKRIQPADLVTHLFGQRRLSRMLDRSESTIYQWRQRGGLVPARYHRRLLELAREHGVRLTAEDLVYGRAA